MTFPRLFAICPETAVFARLLHEEDDGEAPLGSTSRGQGRRREGRRRPARQRRQVNTAAWTWDELEMPERPFTLASGPSLPAGRDFSDPLTVFELFWKPISALMKVYTNRYCHLLLSKAVHPAYRMDGKMCQMKTWMSS